MTSKRKGVSNGPAKLTIAFLILSAAFGISAAAQTADLSGIWILNKAASQLDDQFNMAPKQIKIVQTANDLHVQRLSSFSGNDYTINDRFTLDGKECINPGWADSEKRSTAVWSKDKSSLTITTKIPMGDNGDMTIIEVYRTRGGQLVIESRSSSSFGENSDKLVFDKK